MSAFEIATKFFHACETLKGWDECKQFVAADAPFSAQCEPRGVVARCGVVADRANDPSTHTFCLPQESTGI